MDDDLEKAISQAYNPMASPGARSTAMEYLSSVAESAGGWHTFVQKLFTTSDLQIALVCLTAIGDIILHRYLALSMDERVQLKQALFTFMQQIIGPNTPPTFETKLAVVIVYLFKQDFAGEWPGFFNDLAAASLSTPSGLTASKEHPMSSEDVNSIPSPDGVRMWLRVLMIIHEEVVSNEITRSPTETAHSAAIKDSMRDLAIVDIVETWYNLLVVFHEQDRDVTLATLDVMNVYTSWIDIGLLVNDRFLPLLFKLVTIPDYSAKTMECFHALLSKGMDRDPRAKLELIQTLQLPRILSQIQSTDDEFLGKVAATVNVMGVEILEVYKLIGDEINNEPELNKLASELLNTSLENLWKYFNDDVDDTSRCLIEFARNYLQFLRKLKKINDGILLPEQIEHLNIYIQIIHKKMRYDESYNFDAKDEEEDEFEGFRKTLGELFKTVTKLESSIAFEYVGALISSIGEMNDPLDMEVALRCLWLVGEGCVDVTQGPTASFFHEMFKILIDSKIFNYEEPRVLVSQFFECVTRYSRLFPSVPELILPLLNLWMGKHGVLHPHPGTRARRCTGFTQFVKNLKAPLQSYLMEIVSHLRDFASFRPDSFEHVTYDEQLELFETFGILVGFDRDDGAKHKQYLDLLVMPLVENISNILENKLYLNDTPHNQFHTKWLSYLVRGVGTFSKGFPLPVISTGPPGSARRPNIAAPASEAMIFFAKVFDLVMQIMGVLGEKAEIRSACVFYFQRMAVCLSSAYLLPFLPVITERLLTPLTVPNMNEYAMLLIKLIGTYSSEVGEILDSQLLVIISKLHELIQSTETSLTIQSDEERELLDLKRQYYCFLYTIVSCELTPIFTSQTNLPHLQGILDTIVQGCGIYDPVCQKFAFGTFNNLIRAWLGVGDGNPLVSGLPEGFADTFLAFILQHVVPASFEVPFSTRFNLEDAKASEALMEMAGMERTLWTAIGQQLEQYLLAQLPNSVLQCTPDVAAQYVEGLKSGSTSKQWKKFKSEFIKYHRK